MTNKIAGSFFVADSQSELAWMQSKECAGLCDLLTRADCHGGEEDIFFLCLKEKNIIARIQRDEKTKRVQMLGMAFDAADRKIWYYLPELTAILLEVFQTSDYKTYCISEKSFAWDLDGAETQKIVRRAQEKERDLMQAAARCAEENKNTLEPHSVAFCGIEPEKYEADGIVFYPYAHRTSVKTLPIASKRTKEPALYLKPPKVFRAWTITDKQDKVKISNIRDSQSWNTLYQRILAEWEADLIEPEE